MKCVVCGSDSLSTWDKVRDLAARVVELKNCVECGAIINLGAYEALKSHSPQDLQKTDYYMPSDEEIASAPKKVEECASYFNYLSSVLPLKREWVFCDFGAGRGYVALYASKLFRKSIACEWDARPIDAVKAGLPIVPENFETAEDIDAVKDKIGLLFMWHSLEHLPEPTEFWASRKNLLEDEAVIFLQIPLFRPAHVVDCHYVFWTERSLTKWAASIDAVPLAFGYDADLGFLGMVAQRRV